MYGVIYAQGKPYWRTVFIYIQYVLASSVLVPVGRRGIAMNELKYFTTDLYVKRSFSKSVVQKWTTNL